MTDEDLVAWAEQAKRDDWHLRFVGSDIRQLIGEVQRLRANPMSGHLARACEAAELLASLKAERAALDAKINLIEAGLSRAAYECSLASQLACINDQREIDGKPKLTMSAFLAAADE